MKKVSLWFPTVEALFRFWHTGKIEEAKIIAHKKLLICATSDGNIELACKGYDAQVLKYERVE